MGARPRSAHRHRALTVTAVDFEEALPLAIRGVRAHEGEASAATHLQLIRDAETLEPAAERAFRRSRFASAASGREGIRGTPNGRRADPPRRP
jgi:hypothetical protein